ncbi:dolichyl-phosphate beta-glucosyltransferase [Perkinsus olseni]|uniref:Dolichyl-phosphate beta-glucosyltransferase n=1 Tax=Perkinsus olseni TaxID=32597 RepID=A0A7J6LPH1_PEROL|nr:dolichyl-phosphate beta-glucosyltransferase [Perkinsus olseni]
MALCQQLRTRDCRECELLLQIPGHPIVESSQHMIFGPLEIPKELTKAFNELMAEAGLAVARNEWASVFDFSKGQEPFPSDEHWRVMNEGEMRSRGKLNWHEEARTCLGICVVARDVAPPKDEPGIELEEIEIESADSVRSSVASVELTEERGLCQRLLAGERVEVRDVRDCFKIPLEQSDKHVEEFLVELKLVTDLSSGNSSTTGDHVRDTLLTFFFQSTEDVADHIRTTMVNPQSAATFNKLQELNIVKLFVTGECCSARIMPLIRSSEMAKHVAIRAMLADQCRLAEDAPETYRAGVKALTTKDDRDEAVKALNYRTTKLMDDFEEHYHDSTHVKSVVSKHAILFRRILLWGQVADPETVGYIFEAAASTSEESLQLLSAVLTIDGIEETPAYELHGMSSLVKVVLGTSLSLLPAVLDIVAKSVERAAEIWGWFHRYEAEARDIEPSIVEVDLGDLRAFVKKSLDPLCIRNAAIEIVEVTRPGASGNLVVAKAGLKVLPGSFAVHVEDGFLPYGGHSGEPATISLTAAADSRYSNRYILPVIRATSLELKGIEEMHVEREYMDGGARYKIFPPKAHKGGCYAATRDGACVFYKREEWRLVENLSEIDTELRAPLAMALLERKSEFDDGGEPWKLLVASIHLKAGVTPEASKRREEQLKWVAEKVERAATTHQASSILNGSQGQLSSSFRENMSYGNAIEVKPSTCIHIREALVQTGLSLKKRYPQHELIVMLNAEDDQPYVAEPEKVGSWTIDALERSDISVFDVEDSRCQASLGFALAARPKSVLLLDTRSTGCLPPVIAHFCSDCGVPVAKSTQALNEKIEKKILEVSPTQPT